MRQLIAFGMGGFMLGCAFCAYEFGDESMEDKGRPYLFAILGIMSFGWGLLP